MNQLINIKSRETVNLQCKACGKIFQTNKHSIQCSFRKHQRIILYCSMECAIYLRKINTRFTFNCKLCNKKTTISISNKGTNNFCSRSCAGKYNSVHRTFGTRRSKLEIWLESKLKEKYPNIEFHFNKRDAIKSELDIYIPSLKLAFELNGPFHYEPIFGPERLKSTQNNDQRKFQACLENKIELCIIDTSKQKYFKEHTCQQFLDIITNIIDTKLN